MICLAKEIKLEAVQRRIVRRSLPLRHLSLKTLLQLDGVEEVAIAALYPLRQLVPHVVVRYCLGDHVLFGVFHGNLSVYTDSWRD